MTDFDVILSSRTGQEVVRVTAENGDAAIRAALTPETWVTGISPAMPAPEPVPAPRATLTLPVAAAA